jgi:hypothetical protein
MRKVKVDITVNGAPLCVVAIKKKDYKMITKRAAEQDMTVEEYVNDVINSAGD